MDEPVGRLNRARISWDRYRPGATEINLPVYRASLYDGTLSLSESPSRNKAETRLLDSKPANVGLEQSFSREIVASPPPPPPSKYSPMRSSPSRFVSARAAALKESQLIERSLSRDQAWKDTKSTSSYVPASSGSLDQSFNRSFSIPPERPTSHDNHSAIFNRSNSEPEWYVAKDLQASGGGKQRETIRADANESFRDYDDGSTFRKVAERGEQVVKKQVEEPPKVFDEPETEEEKEFEAPQIEQQRRRSHDYRFRHNKISTTSPTKKSPGKTVSPSKAYVQAVVQGKRGQMEASLIQSSVGATDPAAVRKEIDRLVVEALNLQDLGQFEEAHFLLLKVERLRLEIEIEEGKAKASAPQSEPVAVRHSLQEHHEEPQRARRASLVLEEARKAQMRLPVKSKSPSRRKKEEEEEDDYQDEEFDSLSEEEDISKALSRTIPPSKRLSHSTVRSPRAIVVNNLGTAGAEQHIQELSRVVSQKSGAPQATIQSNAVAVEVKSSPSAVPMVGGESVTIKQEDAIPPPPPPPIVVIPVAHVDASQLEEERERRKREIRKKREEQQIKEQLEQQQAALNEESKLSESRSIPTSIPGADNSTIQELNESVMSSESLSSPMHSKKEPVEEVLRRAFEGLALTFSDASFEPVNLDKDETTKTLDELELARRRREQMGLNPTKSSRLPGINEESFRIFNVVPSEKAEERYASKAGYLVKRVEAPRFGMLSSNFHKRYFVLSGGVLLHLKSEESKLPRGMISLENATVSLGHCKGIQNGYCVVVESPQRNYMLFPKDRREAVEWTVAIEHNAAVFSKLKYEEARQVKHLVRKSLSTSGKANSSAMIAEEVTEQMIGKDVTADDFVDITQLAMSAGGGSMKNLATTTEEKTDEAMATEIGGYYDLLGVSATATTEVIRKAYHKLAKSFHPDKNTSIDAKRFALINRAFHVVQEPETRERYNLGERVKHALRRGVMAEIHTTGGESYPAALYLGPLFTVLYWQDAEYGSQLRRGFKYAELRFVQQCIAGEDDASWPWASTEAAGKRCLSILGERMGHEHLRLELDTSESRDEILDGLRILRCEQSMLFVQKLEQWLKEGNHR